MQFYLLLVFSGVIFGSTVLGQVLVSDYDVTFTYTPTSTRKCSDTTTPDTKSVNFPDGVHCLLYKSSGCAVILQPLENAGCKAVNLVSVGSYACVEVADDTPLM